MYTHRKLRVFLLVLVVLAYLLWGCPTKSQTIASGTNQEEVCQTEGSLASQKPKVESRGARIPTQNEIKIYLSKYPIKTSITPKGYKGPVSSDIKPKVVVRNKDILISFDMTPVTPAPVTVMVNGSDVARAPTQEEIEGFCKNNPKCVKEVKVPVEVTEKDIANYCEANPDECVVYKPGEVTEADVKKYCKKYPKKCQKKVTGTKRKTRSPNKKEIAKFCKRNPNLCNNPISKALNVVSHEEKRIGCMYRTYVNLYTSSNVFAVKYIYPRLDKKVSSIRLKDKSLAISNSAQVMCAVSGERLLVNLESEEGVLVTRKSRRFKYNGTFSAELVDGKTVKLNAKPVMYKGEPFLEIQIPEEK